MSVAPSWVYSTTTVWARDSVYEMLCCSLLLIACGDRAERSQHAAPAAGREADHVRSAHLGSLRRDGRVDGAGLHAVGLVPATQGEAAPALPLVPAGQRAVTPGGHKTKMADTLTNKRSERAKH